MKKLLLSFAAVASLAAAVPASAQPYNHDRFGGRYENINQRERDLAIRIQRGQRDGSLSWREARRLRTELTNIERLERRYRVNGLQAWERNDLNRRLDRLSLQVRGERRDYDRSPGRGPGPDRWPDRR